MWYNGKLFVVGCEIIKLSSLKPARLHFARTARALSEASCAHVTVPLFRARRKKGTITWAQGVLSEFRAARTCASYWFDNAHGKSLLCCAHGNQVYAAGCRALRLKCVSIVIERAGQKLIDRMTGDTRLEFLRKPGA